MRTDVATDSRWQKCVVVVIVGALAHASILTERLAAATAQDKLAAVWDGLPNLPEGTRLQLTLTDGAKLSGRLVEARGDAVVLDGSVLLKGQFQTAAGSSLTDRQTFLRANVVSVKVTQTESRRHNLLLWTGTIVGGVAVFSFLAALDNWCRGGAC